ncbi:MAG: ribonuclease P protein component [Vicinamibacterales bacterium]|nr:ribonuclease P protein component [Acidobacteriota bacterium]MDP6609214.1 ribonuclease P protein component [Vicinamibacterales bacterium]HAK56866.1 ribonuclease P protein component [Acidobacteriota bacterium]
MARESMVAQTLRRDERIRRRPEYQRLHAKGVRTHGRYLTLLILPNDLPTSRLGIVASRRLGGATRRNRAKRLARELFRRAKTDAGVDVVVLPRRAFLDVDFESLEADYRSTLSRHRRRTGTG